MLLIENRKYAEIVFNYRLRQIKDQSFISRDCGHLRKFEFSGRNLSILAYNKKFWEELIRLHTSLHAMVAIVTLAKDCM
jgi:hypothetical protein